MKSHKKLAAFVAALTVAFAALYFHAWLADQVRSAWRQALAWHINPWIFVGLLLATTFHYYKSFFEIARGVVRRDKAMLARGFVLNRFVWAIPYVYVLIFGRGYPLWVPAGVIAWMIFGAAMFARNVRKPEYVSRMTHSWAGRATLWLMKKDPNENKEECP